jgi:hypothetical protein
MIKKIIIRILSIVMLIAFIAVVSVQWIWIKYSMREGEARFTSKVYDVLGKAVNLVEQTNNIRPQNITGLHSPSRIHENPQHAGNISTLTTSNKSDKHNNR